MKDNLPRYTLRVNRVLLNKLEYIAAANGRSANKEIEQLIRRHILQYEQKHGTIDLPAGERTE